MGALQNQPVTQNFLSPHGFRFFLHRLPHVMYFCQSVRLPDITAGIAEVPTPFKKINFYGDNLDYGQLTIEFKVDELLTNYQELYNWMKGVNFPEQHSQHATLASNPVTGGRGVVSDGSLLVLNAAMNPTMQFDFTDMFPTGLSNFNMVSTAPDVIHVTCQATFALTLMQINTNV